MPLGLLFKALCRSSSNAEAVRYLVFIESSIHLLGTLN